MVNTFVQTKRRPAAAALRARPPKPTRADGASTRTLILDAARRRLCEQGYAQLNVRDIAADAGVNHALINYHFHGKQQLVLAVLDEANKQLLERQARMYSAPATAGAKWRQACDFYEQDLQSGFVRLLMELMGASFKDEALRREFVPRLLAWQDLIETAVGEFLEASGLTLPISRSAIAAWITWFWIGMEASTTLGVTEEQGHHREALEAVATLLRLTQARRSPTVRPARSTK
jgi:AcrR family transcriptional regulator